MDLTVFFGYFQVEGICFQNKLRVFFEAPGKVLDNQTSLLSCQILQLASAFPSCLDIIDLIETWCDLSNRKKSLTFDRL